jgi:hypothetical protein
MKQEKKIEGGSRTTAHQTEAQLSQSTDPARVLIRRRLP